MHGTRSLLLLALSAAACPAFAEDCAVDRAVDRAAMLALSPE